jgi:uncharacterized protein YoaH (UPF0181 family)
MAEEIDLSTLTTDQQQQVVEQTQQFLEVAGGDGLTHCLYPAS